MTLITIPTPLSSNIITTNLIPLSNSKIPRHTRNIIITLGPEIFGKVILANSTTTTLETRDKTTTTTTLITQGIHASTITETIIQETIANTTIIVMITIWKIPANSLIIIRETAIITLTPECKEVMSRWTLPTPEIFICKPRKIQTRTTLHQNPGHPTFSQIFDRHGIECESHRERVL